MLSLRLRRKIIYFSISLALMLTSKAFSGDIGFFDDFKHGNWRFESLVGSGLSTNDKADRGGDYYFAGSIEYEWPVYKSHRRVGLRGYPALIYFQDENNKGKNDTIYAGAFGVVVRWYRQLNYKGLYCEIGVAPLWNSRLFRDNAAHWNALTEFGGGYKFDCNWHIALKFQHISNGQTRSPNYGVNALALALGYSF